MRQLTLLLCIIQLFLCLPAEALFAPAKINKVIIEGNKYLEDDEILAVVQSKPGNNFNKDLILEDLKNIYRLGYFEKTGLEARPEENSDGSIDIYYVVNENPPIADVEVYGTKTIAEVDSYTSFSELIGKPENINLLGQKIQVLENEYLKQGYIIARVKDIDIDSDGTLKIYVDEGIIEAINYSGNEKTKKGYLDHLISNIEENQPYNERAFAKDFKKLQSSGYYSNVSRMVTPSADGNGYVLEIEVQEKRMTSIGLGGGINSNAGLFGNINLQVGNIRGQGETLTINGLLGSGFGANSAFNNSRLFRRGNLTQITTRYTMPYFRNSDYNASIFSTFSKGPNYLVDLSDQLNMNAGFNISKSLDDFNRLSYSAAYNFINLDNFDLDPDEKSYVDIISANIQKQEGLSEKAARKEARALRKNQLVDGQYISNKFNYSYVNLDAANKPRDGWKTRLGIEPSFSFGDISSFTKLDGSITKYSKLPWNSSFVFNVRTGYELFGDIPQFTQFRLGGMNGVRGYRQFSDLGVGTKLAISTAEIRSPLYNLIPAIKSNKFLNNVDFAIFADFGLIGGSSRLNRISDRLNRAASVGAGLRVNLPVVGALRVDLGFPLIEALTKNSGFMRLNFGAADQY